MPNDTMQRVLRSNNRGGEMVNALVKGMYRAMPEDQVTLPSSVANPWKGNKTHKVVFSEDVTQPALKALEELGFSKTSRVPPYILDYTPGGATLFSVRVGFAKDKTTLEIQDKVEKSLSRRVAEGELENRIKDVTRRLARRR